MPEFNPSRRALFSKLQRNIEPLPSLFTRPPFAKQEVDFLRLCNQCGDCIKACSANFIKLEHDYPVLDSGDCGDCLDCAQICQTGALECPNLTVKIDFRCDSKIAKYCQSCIEVCPKHAISLQSSQQPVINNELCNGCGECIEACEFNAISFVNLAVLK
ncbi:MAG: 4Fe-4S binding protein [Moritella sp.]|uniref:4Fe-4S binding protein n=1 Tax=Moritella sp. TaxID=78556 RepID=UPI0029A83743|nr:4Fe-4S binding protein [Moritella sp.]MDX2320028.1 4Fe-4S binding protein [Moritella sp.]